MSRPYGSTYMYRSRNGMIAGVCRGVAEYFGFSVGWTRAIVAGTAVLTCFWPVALLYGVAALAMRPEPPIRWEV